jgi:DNA primase
MRFSEQFIQQVAQATDIVDLVGQYVALKKAGREYKGLCPFHDDHHASMSVSPTKQIFKCFSCGAGGGVFQFATLYEKLTFPEAVRMLAERAHIPLPQDPHAGPAAPEGYGKAELAEVTAFATQFYRTLLRGPQGAAALEYAHKRGFTDESIEHFSLGYAPSGWDGLLKAARTKGFRESQLSAAGLVIRRESGEGCYDRFRNRLMFPILEPGGKVIAFGGRALDPEDRAKYLNSAESVLFDKSGSLFALNWSREGIVATGQAVVAEGYLDALIPLQAGINNIVATLGTSLTERHVRLLSRYAREVVLVFDADAAGAAAADRGLELFLAQRINVRVATIPAGKDPCDYVLACGADAFRKVLAEAPDAIQYAWLRRQAKWQAAGANLADRQAVVDDFLRLVVLSTAYDAIDEVRRGQLAQHIAHLLNLPATDLQLQMRRLARQSRGSAAPASGRADAGVWHADQRTGLAERQLLEVLINRPDLFDLAAERIDPADFQDAELRTVAEAVWALGQAGRLCMEELLAAEATSNRGALLTDLAREGERRGNYDQVLRDMVSHLLYWREKHQLPAAPDGQYAEEDLREVMRRVQAGDPRRDMKIK